MRHYAERFGLERVALVGYSMGGNMVLKLAGEWGSRPPLFAVAAVCPAIDLAPGADALHEPLNRGYEWRFLFGLKARYTRKAKLFPRIYAPPREIGPIDSIRAHADFERQGRSLHPHAAGDARQTPRQPVCDVD
jgi:hypothetical protein